MIGETLVFEQEDLATNKVAAAAYLRVMIAQIEGGVDWVFHPLDPIADIEAINRLRVVLEGEGHAVPPMPDAWNDPLANMMAWRDFLSRFVTVH